MKIDIKRLPNCQQLPLAATSGSVGMDLFAAAGCQIKPGETEIVPCGFAIAVPEGFGMFILPRSGLSRAGIIVANSPGLVDSDYRGEVCVILTNHSDQVFTVNLGSRIAQCIILPVPRVEWCEVEELSATARGAGGFGSTGNR